MKDSDIDEALRPSEGIRLDGVGIRRHAGKIRGYAPINVRGVKYTHYATCTKKILAEKARQEVINSGFKVLVRKYGPRKYHIYKGPKRRRR